MLYVAVLCLVFLTPVWSSSHCDGWQSFYVGDGNIEWTVTVDGQEEADLLYPSTSEVEVTGNKMKMDVNTGTRANQLKVKQLSLEVKGVTKVKLGSDVVKIAEISDYTRVTFALNANENSIEIKLLTKGHQGSIRSVFISGCYDDNMVSINKGLDLFKAKWEAGIPVGDFVHDFYTSDAIFIEPGQPIRKGPYAIAKYIFGPVQAVRPTVDIDVQLAEKLSEMRMFTFHLAVFYNDRDIGDPPRRYFILWKKESISEGWKVNRVTVNYQDPPTELIEDIGNLP